MRRIIALCLIVFFSSCSVVTACKEEDRGDEDRVVEGQRLVQETLIARAEQIAEEFCNYRCPMMYGEPHFVAQTEENRANVIARVKRYLENPANFEHVQNLNIDHFTNEILDHILRSPDVRTEYKKFFKTQIINLSENTTPVQAPLCSVA
jgi:hypothetical protein